jgi:hypothetical protein
MASYMKGETDRFSKNRMLTRILGPERKEATGVRRGVS